MKHCSIDFEYRGTSESKLDLICCSMTTDEGVFEYWLRDKKEFEKCKTHILSIRDTHRLLCWNYVAEGQSLISMNINPIKFKCIDVQQEYKMLLNHNHKYMYGKQLIGGKVVTTRPPDYGKDKTVNNSRPKSNLAAGCFKLLNVKIDTEHKDEMRNICIYGSTAKLEENRKVIQDYCTSDTKYLMTMWEIIKTEYLEFFKRKPSCVMYEHVYFRAETMARTAVMTSLGYPVDVEKMKNFSKNVPKLLKELCEDINSQFEYDLFSWNNREQRYSKQTKVMKSLILESEYKDNWIMTDSGQYSLKLEAFEKHFNARHSFKRECPFSQYLRYLKTQRSLNGFIPKSANAKNKETIYDSLGSDGRVRSWLNPYGSQSGRYQPKATSFIPLKSAWLRSLIISKKGMSIASIDYKSEEFLLGALLSKDKNMLDAYESGDVYLHFAKLAGAVPLDGTKEEYKEERNLFKATTLGISYLMGAEALGRKLSLDTGKNITKSKAQELINKFSKAYSKYTEYQDDVYYTYQKRNFWMLPCGWTMFGDNENHRSVKNMPVQGMGSSILRKAIQLAQDDGLKVLFPLHDALYIEYKSSDLRDVDTLKRCMQEAFAFYFEGDMKKKAFDLIGFDVDIWSPDYVDGIVTTPKGLECKSQSIYIDQRSKSEYEKFKQYMEL